MRQLTISEIHDRFIELAPAFAKYAAPLFAACEQTWSCLEGPRVPNEDDLIGMVLDLAANIRNVKEDAPCWAASSGRVILEFHRWLSCTNVRIIYAAASVEHSS